MASLSNYIGVARKRGSDPLWVQSWQDRIKQTRGRNEPVGCSRILFGPLAKHVPAGAIQFIFRYLDGDALSGIAGLFDPNLEGERQHRGPRGWFRAGNAKYRSRIFGSAVRQAATA